MNLYRRNGTMSMLSFELTCTTVDTAAADLVNEV